VSTFGAGKAQAGPFPGRTNGPFDRSEGIIQKWDWKGIRGAAREPGHRRKDPACRAGKGELAAGANPAHWFGQGRLEHLGGAPPFCSPEGKGVPKEVIRDYPLVFTDQAITTRRGGKAVAVQPYRLIPSSAPKQLIATRTKGLKKEEFPCIYLPEGDTREIGGADTTREPPKAFATKVDNDRILMVLRRVEP
jgi:hypothetical protein